MLGAIPIEPIETKKCDYLKEKVNKLEEKSKNKIIWEMYKGINEFTKGYQPCAYVIKKQDGTIVGDTIKLKIKFMAYSSQGSHTGQLDFRN